MKKVFVLVLAVLALAGLTACGSKSGRSGTDAELIGVFVTAEPEMPEGKEYRIGDRLDLTGLELTAVYADGRRETLSNDDIVVDEPDTFKTAGRKRITVTPKEEILAEGGRKTAYFFVDVVSDKGIISAGITRQPEKMEYFAGEKLDLKGIEVTVTRKQDDGKAVTEVFREDAFSDIGDVFIPAPAEPDRTESMTVSLMIEDYELPFTVTVLNPDNPENPNETVTPVTPADEEQNKQNSGPSVTSIEVNPGSLEKTKYFVGDKFDKTGLTLTASMSDDTKQTITETSAFSCTVGESDSDVFGKAGKEIRVKISYTDPRSGETLNTALNVTVKEKLTSVKVKPTDGAKAEYRPNDPFDETGFLLTLHYDDGSTKGRDVDTSEGLTFESESFATEGKKTVKVFYTDPDTQEKFTAELTVTVTKAKLTGITVKNEPRKTKYKVGEKFDKTGLTLTAAYDDGREETVAADAAIACTVEGTASDAFTKAGDRINVTVKYNDKTTSVTVHVIELARIEVDSDSVKKEYFVGEKFDKTGLTLTAFYSDDKTYETITDTGEFTCTPEQFDKAGTQTITVTYKEGSVEKIAYFEVTVLKLTGIKVKNQPKKTEYFVGEEFDPAGLTLTATYDDGTTNGTTKEVTEGFICTPDPFTLAGEKTVTVEYTDKNQTTTVETTFTVTVKENSVLTGITVNADNVTKEYFVGEAFNPAGLVVTATYNYGEPKTIEPTAADTKGITWDPATFAAKGDWIPVTISYTEGTTTVKAEPIYVTVNAQLTGIEVKDEPETTEYFVGQSFDPTGLTLTATYSDGNTETITEGFACTVEDTDSDVFDKAGNAAQVKVTYGGKETSVAVKAFELIEITANADNVKKEYFLGESFNPEGLTLTVTCSDGSDDPITKTIMEGFTCTVEDTESDVFDKKGEEIRVTVSYLGKTDSFGVTVKPVLSTITLNTDNARTIYHVGESFDPKGLTLTATYSDGSDDPITEGFTCTVEDTDSDVFDKKGEEIRVTISYQQKTADFKVTVKSAVKEIAIGDMPKKTEYIVGETFDPTGLTLNVTCDGESDVETIDTGFEWDPKSFALNGDKIEVTIRYAGKTTTLVVKVNKNPMSIN